MNDQSPKERLAYSLKEAAELIGVSEGHLRNEQRRGRLQFIHSGRCTRILAAELIRYLTQLQCGSGQLNEKDKRRPE